MLENVNSIDWEHLHLCVGLAGRAPEWLWALRSEDPEVREDAAGRLFGFGQHRGMIFEATPYLVPFLIELVAAPDTPERGSLLAYLAHLLPKYLSPYRSLLPGDEAETAATILAAKDLYLGLLGDPETDTRLGAYEVLCGYPRQEAEDIVERLTRLARAEADTGILCKMIDMLANYVEHGCVLSSYSTNRLQKCLLEFFSELLSPDRAPRARLMAAANYLNLCGQLTREHAAVIPALARDALLQPDRFIVHDDEYGFLPPEWVLTHYAIPMLDYLPRPVRITLLVEAIGAALYAEDAHLFGHALLETLFFGRVRADQPDSRGWGSNVKTQALRSQSMHIKHDPQKHLDNRKAPWRSQNQPAPGEFHIWGKIYYASAPPADLTILSPAELGLLRFVLDTDLVWMVHTNLLEVYGLPTHRSDALALLDQMG